MEIKSHPGTVCSVTEGHVEVRFEAHSACSACEAHARCGFAESKDKTVTIDTDDWQAYSVGQDVTVQISEGLGLQATVWAYVLPAAVMLATIITLLTLGVNELAAIGATFGVLLLYGLVLYALRHKLQRHFTVKVTPNN